jgi:hypothetical protein
MSTYLARALLKIIAPTHPKNIRPTAPRAALRAKPLYPDGGDKDRAHNIEMTRQRISNGSKYRITLHKGPARLSKRVPYIWKNAKKSVKANGQDCTE